eukprot:2052378-Amphidinium_carterae.1
MGISSNTTVRLSVFQKDSQACVQMAGACELSVQDVSKPFAAKCVRTCQNRDELAQKTTAVRVIMQCPSTRSALAHLKSQLKEGIVAFTD